MTLKNPPFVVKNSSVSNQNSPRGELAVLDSHDPKFGLESLKYPENLGDDDVPHWIMFNIYVPDGDVYAVNKFGQASGDSRSQDNIDFQNKGPGKRQSQITKTGIGIAAGVRTITQFVEAEGSIGDSVNSALGAGAKTGIGGLAVGALGDEVISFRPKIRRINKSVGIYMPDTVMSTYSHDHSAISGTGALGDLGKYSAMGESVAAAIKEVKLNATDMDGAYKKVGDILGKVVGSAGGREALGDLAEKSGLVGDGFTDLASKSAGLAVNPQVELVFRGTANRSFIFEFKFQPRSRKEAQTIFNILKTFKSFAAPSISPNSRGRYFIPPASFDIQFKFRNMENEYLSKISTSVLEAIDINYSGAGQWATMEDGMPVEINVQLRFKEADIITRELIDEFNY